MINEIKLLKRLILWGFLGGLWFRQEDRIRKKDMDILWNTRVCRSRNYSEQGEMRQKIPGDFSIVDVHLPVRLFFT